MNYSISELLNISRIFVSAKRTQHLRHKSSLSLSDRLSKFVPQVSGTGIGKDFCLRENGLHFCMRERGNYGLTKSANQIWIRMCMQATQALLHED